MGRPKSTIRISLKGKDGKSVRLNLHWCQITRSFFVYRDGSRSEKCPMASATAIGKRVTDWLISQN
jgi:hypothetical protein